MTDSPTPPTSDPASSYIYAGDVLEGVENALQTAEGLLELLDRFRSSEEVSQARERAGSLLYGLRFQVTILGRTLRGDPAKVPVDDSLILAAVCALDALRSPEASTMSARAHAATQAITAALCHLVAVESSDRANRGT